MASTMEPAPPAEPRTPMERTILLRFFAFRKNDKWYVECLDLSLIASRPEFRDAVQALYQQVALYLRTAAESGNWDELVPRPAPRSRWVIYYYATLLSEVRRLLHMLNNLTSYAFRVPFDRSGHQIGQSA